MAIHVEHVGVLERAREVSRLEDIGDAANLLI